MVREEKVSEEFLLADDFVVKKVDKLVQLDGNISASSEEVEVEVGGDVVKTEHHNITTAARAELRCASRQIRRGGRGERLRARLLVG